MYSRCSLTYIRLPLEPIAREVVPQELLVEAGLVLSHRDGGRPEAGAVGGSVSMREGREVR